jgi:LacI family transcriptional regulator
MASIEKLGYRPSAAARGMRGRTYRVGILLIGITNPFLPEVIDGILATLTEASYHGMIGIGQSRTEIEASLIETMIDSHMDGLILVAPEMVSAVLSHYARQIPVVAIAQHEPAATDFDTVNSDDRLGATMAVAALVARGHRDIAMLMPDPSATQVHGVMLQRELGYRQAMAEAGLADRIRVATVPHRGADAAQARREAAIRVILSGPERPRALFCWSDLLGVDVVNVARCMGLRVPEDLAVIGYDNSSVAALPLIGLASIDQKGRQMGALAARTLLGRIDGRSKAEHLTVPPHLVLRPSV